MRRKILTGFLILSLIGGFAYGQFGGGGPFGAIVNYLKKVATHIIPSADDTYDLGSSSKEFRNAYIDGTANIDAMTVGATTGTGDLTLDDGSGDSPILSLKADEGFMIEPLNYAPNVLPDGGAFLFILTFYFLAFLF